MTTARGLWAQYVLWASAFLFSTGTAASGQTAAPTLEVETSTVPFERYISEPKPVENRIESMDVYKLAKSAYKLRSGHMLSLPLYQKVRKAKSLDEFKNLIAAQARAHGLEWQLIAAVIMTESGFNPQAVSHKGAQGLMQLMPDTWVDLGVTDPLDPAENIAAGSAYLKAQLQKFKSVELALAAYNAGPGSVARAGGVPPYTETKNFITRVMGFYQQYKSQGLQEQLK